MIRRISTPGVVRRTVPCITFSKARNDKEGKAGVSVGKKYKYKDAGNRVCDCHDMLSACLAMTGEERVTSYEIIVSTFGRFAMTKEKELFAMTKREQITQYTKHII
jgi:hypothetical protein